MLHNGHNTFINAKKIFYIIYSPIIYRAKVVQEYEKS